MKGDVLQLESEVEAIKHRLQQGSDGNGRPRSATPRAHDHAGEGDGGTLTNSHHDGYDDFDEIAEPASPPAGRVRLFAISGDMKQKDSAGTVTNLASGGGGGSALTVREEDGTPSDAAVETIRVPNASLIVNASGDVSLDYATATDFSVITAALAAHEADATDAHDASAISILDTAADFTATNVEDALAELQAADEADEAALAAHIADSSAAHAASAISLLDAAADFVATDVEAAIAELQTRAEADDAALAAHLADSSDAHDASSISIVDAAGDFTATDVEGALAELQSDHEADEAALAAHVGDSSDAHDASAVSLLDAETLLDATNVEDAIAELAARGTRQLIAYWFLGGPQEAHATNQQGAVWTLPTWARAADDLQLMANVSTAPAGADLELDVMRADTLTGTQTSLFSTKPEIDNGARELDGNQVFSTTSLNGKYLFLRVTQTGTGLNRGFDLWVGLYAMVYPENP